MRFISLLLYNISIRGDEQMSLFVERLKNLRDGEGTFQKTIGQLAGKSREPVSKYETGEREPDLLDMAALAKHFQITSDYVLGLTDNKTLFTDYSEKTRPYTNDSRFRTYLEIIFKDINNDIDNDIDIIDKVIYGLFPYKCKLYPKRKGNSLSQV